MKQKGKDEIRSNTATGIVKNVTTLLSKIPKVSLRVAPIVDTYSQTVSKEQKAQVARVELKKAQALAEAQRRRMRIL